MMKNYDESEDDVTNEHIHPHADLPHASNDDSPKTSWQLQITLYKTFYQETVLLQEIREYFTIVTELMEEEHYVAPEELQLLQRLNDAISTAIKLIQDLHEAQSGLIKILQARQVNAAKAQN